MALTETSNIAEITSLPQTGDIQVKWKYTIESDGVVVSERDHYRRYAQDQKADFLAEVAGGQAYADAMGW